MAANTDMFVEEHKVLSAEERLEALLMAARNRSVSAEFPHLAPGVHTVLEINAQLLEKLAT